MFPSKSRYRILYPAFRRQARAPVFPLPGYPTRRARTGALSSSLAALAIQIIRYQAAILLHNFFSGGGRGHDKNCDISIR